MAGQYFGTRLQPPMGEMGQKIESFGVVGPQGAELSSEAELKSGIITKRWGVTGPPLKKMGRKSLTLCTVDSGSEGEKEREKTGDGICRDRNDQVCS